MPSSERCETTAMGAMLEAWIRVLGTSRICRCRAHGAVIRRRSLSAIIVAALIPDQTIGEMFIGGVSMTRVGEVVETLTGTKPSASTVSRVFHTLESEYEQWKTRKLCEHYLYAFADGTYFTVIYNGEGCKMPILAVVGIAETGEREVLAFSVGDRENEQAWKDLLEELKQRGVKAIDLW
jgi:putative transposase